MVFCPICFFLPHDPAGHQGCSLNRSGFWPPKGTRNRKNGEIFCVILTIFVAIKNFKNKKAEMVTCG
jgi:hypothetical protein